MFRPFLTVFGVATGLALVGAPARAQMPSSPIAVNRGEKQITPYAGYIFTSHFANGPYSTSLGTGNGAIYGVQLGLPLSPNASLIGGIAYSSADLQAKQSILGGYNIGTSVAWVYEGDLELRASTQTQGLLMGFQPFLQVGAGAIHRSLTAIGLSATSTDFAINGGVGLDFQVTPGVALRVMAKDYVGKATFDSGLAQTNTLNNLALDAGARLSF